MLAMGNNHTVPAPRVHARGASARSARSVSVSAHGAPVASAKHLIVEANGIYGFPGNWDVINQHLTKRLDMDHYMIYASKANQKTDTFDGIDVCGKRLAEEIQQVVAGQPELQYISMLGHSMGGLVLRYAAGYLYDKKEQRIAGLTPVHFISMATPHLGCDATDGEHQVPFVKWLGVSRPIASFLAKLSVPVTGMMFGLSGRQLFMAEPEVVAARHKNSSQQSPKPPLLLRLAFDVPGEGHFFSALKSFHSRTCYGNTGRDHLVGWANSTLRFTDELPELNLRDRQAVPTAKGVILEDPAHLALWQDGSADGSSGGDHSARLNSDVPEELPAQAETSGAAEQGEGAMVDDAATSDDTAGLDRHVDQALHHEFQASATVPMSLDDLVRGPRAAQSSIVLQRLRALGWARVDCAWRDARLGAFAHNHIQVTRGWLNFEGRSVCDHLAKRFLELEDGMPGCHRSYTLPLTSRRPPGSKALSSLELSQEGEPERPVSR
eukprot:jgi/Ulvmu1/3113/UM015_0153.1